MKRYIKSSSNRKYIHDFSEWSQSDRDLYNSIDWKSRNYRDYIVKSDTYTGEANLYGFGDVKSAKFVRFVKHIPANKIFPPYYAPIENPFEEYDRYKFVGPMYDGDTFDGYMVYNRYESEEVYDMLSR